MLKKDKTYYLVNYLTMLLVLGLSLVYSNDIHLNNGDNLVFYPFESSQSFKDGIKPLNLIICKARSIIFTGSPISNRKISPFLDIAPA